MSADTALTPEELRETERGIDVLRAVAQEYEETANNWNVHMRAADRLRHRARATVLRVMAGRVASLVAMARQAAALPRSPTTMAEPTTELSPLAHVHHALDVVGRMVDFGLLNFADALTIELREELCSARDKLLAALRSSSAGRGEELGRERDAALLAQARAERTHADLRVLCGETRAQMHAMLDKLTVAERQRDEAEAWLEEERRARREAAQEAATLLHGIADGSGELNLDDRVRLRAAAAALTPPPSREGAPEPRSRFDCVHEMVEHMESAALTPAPSAPAGGCDPDCSRCVPGQPCDPTCTLCADARQNAATTEPTCGYLVGSAMGADVCGACLPCPRHDPPASHRPTNAPCPECGYTIRHSLFQTCWCCGHAFNDEPAPPATTPNTRPWHEYPEGTKAYAVGGGYWIKEARGWRWHVGDTFPAPGADVYRVESPASTPGAPAPEPMCNGCNLGWPIDTRPLHHAPHYDGVGPDEHIVCTRPRASTPGGAPKGTAGAGAGGIDHDGSTTPPARDAATPEGETPEREETIDLLDALSDLTSELQEARAARAQAEGELAWVRKHCRVVFYPPNNEYPIEHTMAARKDSWDSLMAEAHAALPHLEETPDDR